MWKLMRFIQILLNFIAKVQLTISHHWFRWWLSAKQMTNHYLNQWWSGIDGSVQDCSISIDNTLELLQYCPKTLICVTQHLWVGADSRFAPSQWETVLLCNNVSHWWGASLEAALWVTGTCIMWQRNLKSFGIACIMRLRRNGCISQMTFS